MADEFIGKELAKGNDILSYIPSPLIQAEAFLDRMTNLWRYEFGIPYTVNGSLVWGTDMWVLADNLVQAIKTVCSKLNEAQRTEYLNRLNVPEKHLDVLVEMIPGCKVGTDVIVDFEVTGHGVGNRTIDWLLRPDGGKHILIDVKRRMTDFIHNISNQEETINSAHDHSLLFRSVESKFNSASPKGILQGVWIVTNIKQDIEKLLTAFEQLDSTKVHFAVLGDWNNDVFVLSRCEADKDYILGVLGLNESNRFLVGNNP
jgi:hypothetical protein